MREHAYRAFVLFDPCQDWEESATILGVYGSLEAAQRALPRIRRLPYAEGGVYEYSPYRLSEVALYAGDEVLGRWQFDPVSKPRWRVLLEPGSPESETGDDRG